MSACPCPARNFNHTKGDCAATSGVALAAQPGRVSALLMNDSDTKMYLKFGDEAVLGEGIPLLPDSNYEITIVDGTMVNDVINCIHGGVGNKRLLVFERDNDAAA